ncbi:MAG TPA: DUF2244 domain-containing protein [Gammaproteobacteria bacterium]|jgi:uncharacterized membrane protein|nr:DUF2244 domain-containing protein [Gammaproteobacteria bacterium]
MLEIELDAASQRIVMVPNRSLTRTALWVFYGSLSVVTLVLAGWFALHGFWPVLVYAVLELVWLGFCQRLCWQRGGYSEQIVVRGESVIVDRERSHHRHEHMEFNRYWAQVVVKVPDARLHSRRLFIRSHGRECEVGRCLADDERDSLEQRLASLIGPVGNMGRI